MIILCVEIFQMHKKILDKGKPEDAMPGDKTKKVLGQDNKIIAS